MDSPPSLRSLLAFAGTVGLALAVPQKVVSSRTLKVPSHAPAGKQIVSANYQSYSIEFSYMQDFAGNNSYVAQNIPAPRLGWNVSRLTV